MLFLDFFTRDKLNRFAREIREEGIGNAVGKTYSYVGRRLKGQGITGLLRKGDGGSRAPGEYMAPVWLELAEQNAFHVTKAPAVLSKRRRIAMIGDINLQQCRKYRVEQLDELWHLKNVDYGYCHYQDVETAIALMQEATHVMLYRLSSMPVTSMLTYEARRLRLPVLYDLDDPLFSVSAYGTYENMKALPDWQKTHFMTEAPKYLDVMNGADMISVSTPGMQAHTRLYTPRPVHMRRNFADRIALEAGARAMQNARTVKQGSKDFRVAFASGSKGHEIDFELIADDVIAFLAGQPNRKLVILGHFDKKLLPEALRGQVESHAFSTYEAYLQNLASVDCAVMPLTDDLFNRCKSAVRVIDAASVGVPGIVGTVSDMANMIQDGVNGRVIKPGQSWATALEDMALDRGATDNMGQAARRALEENWAVSLKPNVVDPEILAWVDA